MLIPLNRSSPVAKKLRVSKSGLSTESNPAYGVPVGVPQEQLAGTQSTPEEALYAEVPN